MISQCLYLSVLLSSYGNFDDIRCSFSVVVKPGFPLVRFFSASRLFFMQMKIAITSGIFCVVRNPRPKIFWFDAGRPILTFKPVFPLLFTHIWALPLIRPINSQPSVLRSQNDAFGNPASVTMMTQVCGFTEVATASGKLAGSVQYAFFPKELSSSVKASNARCRAGWREGRDISETESRSSQR